MTELEHFRAQKDAFFKTHPHSPLTAEQQAIFTGLRLSLQACWMVLVAAELVGSLTGLGHVMIIATRDLNPGMIFIGMATVAILGVLMTIVLAGVERRVMPLRR